MSASHPRRVLSPFPHRRSFCTDREPKTRPATRNGLVFCKERRVVTIDRPVPSGIVLLSDTSKGSDDRRTPAHDRHAQAFDLGRGKSHLENLQRIGSPKRSHRGEERALRSGSRISKKIRRICRSRGRQNIVRVGNIRPRARNSAMRIVYFSSESLLPIRRSVYSRWPASHLPCTDTVLDRKTRRKSHER